MQAPLPSPASDPAPSSRRFATPGDVFEQRARARVGATFAGKWRLDAILGFGGTSVVYAATGSDGVRAAIKIIRPELAGSARGRARLRREIHVANELAAEGGVPVLEDGVDGADVYLVMELLYGETLSARVVAAGGRLPAADALRLAGGVLQVLAAAHTRGIVHRDVKPENIFVTTQGAVRVLDFGFARLDGPHAATDGLTRSGATLGTPAFMSPEQARGRTRDVDARTDVWGVGAMLFTILTGRHVHGGETIGEALVMAGSQPAPPLAMFLPSLPRPLLRVVDRALAFRPEDRFADASVMLAALRAAERGEEALEPSALTIGTLSEGDGAAAHDTPTGTGSSRRQLRAAWVVSLALVVTVVGFAARARDRGTAAAPAPNRAAAPVLAPVAAVVLTEAATAPAPALPPTTSAPPPAPKPALVPPADRKKAFRPIRAVSPPPADSTPPPAVPPLAAAPAATAPPPVTLDDLLDHRK